MQAYVDAVLDLASHFITRLRRYASFCRTLASHVGTTAGVGSGRNMVTSSRHSSESPPINQGGQSGTISSGGSSQMQAWVQGAIAKIGSTTDGVPNSPPNPRSGPSTFIPISINTGTFPGTPAVRLIGDCHFLNRLCQLLLFCYFFWRRQMPRYSGSAQKDLTKKEQNTVSTRPASAMKSEEVHTTRTGQGVKGAEESPAKVAPRLGSGNAGHGYTHEEVKVLFLITVELCRRTAGLAHPFPVSQVGGSNIQIRLHYIDGNYTVLPEVVEASLGPLMQNMPRPRGADAAGLLLRELDLHPPAEEWHRRNMLGGPCFDTEDLGPLDDSVKLSTCDLLEFNALKGCDSSCQPLGLWPRKRRLSERDAAFGLKSSVGLGPYLGLMGSRRDVLTAVWKKGLEGVWYKNMPRPRGADAAGLLLRELDLHPPAEEWHRRNMLGGPCFDTEDLGPLDDSVKLSTCDLLEFNALKGCDSSCQPLGLWPRKRRLSERDAAFGLKSSVGLGPYLGLMGSRRDVLTAVWKKGLEGVWYKCVRCLRQTSAFASPVEANPSIQNDRVAWWISQWSYGCPICGGTWVRVV
ncbi:Mediator of rna polymerase ii transcription subunit [Thalictrum thalictroides]|uniref:Mediator of rna polymerase ii transcription subunit n=1 Tax=Thalictrum thalictroides TaxID=46969 RepID=A0A7J6V6U7_THATH|nr:Mediator of rna polymerase ii transcription subunit [Thalictrum thalictroides]